MRTWFLVCWLLHASVRNDRTTSLRNDRILDVAEKCGLKNFFSLRSYTFFVYANVKNFQCHQYDRIFIFAHEKFLLRNHHDFSNLGISPTPLKEDKAKGTVGFSGSEPKMGPKMAGYHRLDGFYGFLPFLKN